MSDTITDLVKDKTEESEFRALVFDEEVAAVDRVKMKMSAQILLFHIKKKFVILYVYCNTIDRRGCEGGFRNGKQDNSCDWNEQFHRNSKESLLLY